MATGLWRIEKMANANFEYDLFQSALELYLLTSVVFHHIGTPITMMMNAKANEAKTR